jgi:hypothetical protein
MVLQHAKRMLAAGPGDAIEEPALGDKRRKRGITIAGGVRAIWTECRCQISRSDCRGFGQGCSTGGRGGITLATVHANAPHLGR